MEEYPTGDPTGATVGTSTYDHYARGQGAELPASYVSNSERSATDKHPVSHGSSKKRSGAPTPSQRYAVREHIKELQSAAERLERGAKAEDAIEKSLAGADLLASLQDLWNLRHVREYEWRSLVNFLQGTLLRQDFEQFTPTQCQAINEIVSHILSCGVSKDDVVSARLALRRAGLDPWRVLSPGEAHG